MTTRSHRFDCAAQRLGFDFNAPIKVGGHYAPLVQHGDLCYLSGQVPRVGDAVVVTGRVGLDVSLAQGQAAAQIGVMRCLALLRQQLGSLDAIDRILRVTVFVQCTAHFTQHSEVADGASDLLVEILGDSAVHSRTSVGVYALPKNAAVELDMIAAVKS
jgi:enamine deaminase RidA (YjgF/YER057c/UK114 family)